MTKVYDKFMIDNPPDNHFDKMKLNGIFINWNEYLKPFIMSTEVDLRFGFATSYMSIIHSNYDSDYFTDRSIRQRLLKYNNGNRPTVYSGYIFENNEHVDQYILIYQNSDMISIMLSDGCFK